MELTEYPRKIDVYRNIPAFRILRRFISHNIVDIVPGFIVWMNVYDKRITINEKLSYYGLGLEFVLNTMDQLIGVNLVIPDADSELNYSAFVLEWS